MTGQIVKSLLGLAGISAAAMMAFAGAAEAGKCKGRHCAPPPYADEPGVYRYVRAEATTGGQVVTGPVRPGKWGDQVRTPGGNWVDCEITCEYTLRRLTVDFWDGIGSGRSVSPGYFRFDIDLDTGHVYRRGPRVLGRY
jgi:hypothetical protein